MDDDGLLIAERQKHSDSASSTLCHSTSEPRFSKYQPFTLNNLASVPQKLDSMNTNNQPEINFGAIYPQTQQQVTQQGPGPATGGVSKFEFDAAWHWQSGQSRLRSKQVERGPMAALGAEYLSETPPRRHRDRSHGDRSRARTRHLSGSSHPPLNATTSSGWDSFSDKEQYQSYASLGIGFASLVAETLLSHPCIVLRRQCQVMNDSHSYHLMPFSLMPVIYNLQKSQGVTCLWKGIGSIFIVRGLHLVTENLVSEITNFPKEVNRHSSSKKVAQHLCLKAVTFALVAPFYAASLVETVQSDIASDSPGVLDCLKEGAARLLVLSTPAASSNLLPFWKLVPPIVCLGVASYAIRSLANYAVMRSAEAATAGSAAGARHYRGLRGRSTEVDSELYERFYPELLSSFVGALLSDLLLYPLETLTHRLCVQGTRTLIDNMDTGLGVASLSTAYMGLGDALVTTVRLETPLSLFRGFGALLLQFGAHLCLLRAAKMSYAKLVDTWGDRRDAEARLEPDSRSTSNSNFFSDTDEPQVPSASGQVDST